MLESNLEYAIIKFDVLKNKLDLTDTIKERAIYLYKKMISKNITKGRSTDELIATIIYAACRDSDVPLTLNDISKVTELKKKLIARYYRAILVNLNLRMPVSSINQCVLRILKDINESEKVKQYAFDILDNVKKKK